MRTNKLAFITFIVIYGITVAFHALDIFQFTLRDLDNVPFRFENHRGNKATVVVFLLSDCPASESYTRTLNQLARKYEKDNVKFTGVFPGRFSSDEELIMFQKTYKLTFPLVKDPEMALVKYLSAKIAPSCFLIDANSKVIYKGRIDDWLYALGKKRLKVTENNLDDAISSVVNGTELKVKETNAIGCIIEYE